ncbi:MAG: hypothetical protein Q4D76_18875 [Oscillospiraceae bacterium]|nr:hypothetical protein [Oscillospiraceae bacterium]
MKKTHIYRWLSRIYYKIFVMATERRFQGKEKYIFRKKSATDILVIMFSGFPGNEKAKYNYMRTIHSVMCNQLFILDDFGYQKKGSYYLAEAGDDYVERLTLELINKICKENNIKHIITAGSSKGGGMCNILWIKNTC